MGFICIKSGIFKSITLFMKDKLIFLLGFFLFFSRTIVLSQGLDSTITLFQNFHKKSPEEKVYISTDKEVYVQNDTLWFSAFLLDAQTHVASKLSTVVYVDLLAPSKKVIASLTLDMKGAVGKGSFLLADSLLDGAYTLRAYSNYMRNNLVDFIFSKPIQLFKFSRTSADNKIETKTATLSVQFFPEGGVILQGAPNVVAYQITDQNGNGLPIEGYLIDSDDKIITKIEPKKFGLGKFQFTPQTSSRYRAIFTHNGHDWENELPTVTEFGYQLIIRKTTEKTYLTVKGSPGVSFDNAYLLTHIRGQIIAATVAAAGKDFIYSSMDNIEIPSGIIHVTLFKDNEPLVERLIYNENKSENIQVNAVVTPFLQKRQLADFDLKFVGSGQAAVNGNFSVVVQKSSQKENQLNIENYLLLSSDLKGQIEYPDYYTDRSNPDRLEMIDLLMLIHGWRRFDWHQLLNNELPVVNYYPEKGFTLEGKVVKWENRSKPLEAALFLTFLENMSYQQVTRSDEDGNFWFDGLQIEDSITAIVQTASQKKGRKDQKIINSYIDIRKQSFPNYHEKFLSSFGSKNDYEEYLNDMLTLAQIKASFDGSVVILDEIAVEADIDKRTDPFYRPEMLYDLPDARVVLDSITTGYTNVFDIIKGRLTGVQFSQDEQGEYKAIIRGNTSIMLDNYAIFLLDGMVTSSYVISAINPLDISHVDILKGTRANLYGTPNGVIAFYRKESRTGVTLSTTMGITNLKMVGYHKPDAFYVPNHSNPSESDLIRPDRRGTQYWNPDVIISEGKASFSYFTSDDLGDFTAYIEGITDDGRLIRKKINFEIR